MQIPLIQSSLQDLMLLQTKWRSILNPFLAIASLNTSILPNVSLKIGANVINHLLGRNLTGWRIVRKRATADIWDTQDSNQTPSLTLNLMSSAVIVIDLEVF